MTSEAEEILERPFGAENRQRLLVKYFSTAGAITPASAWLHVYRLLLWADRTTGLAHCYESDKCQPGRPWYERSLRFHGWLASRLGVSPAVLGQQLDWMFLRGTEQFMEVLARQRVQRAERAETQRAGYEGFPLPWDNPSLGELITEKLGPWLAGAPDPAVMRQLIQHIQAYIAQENRRRNLLGEGFEDVLAFIIGQLPGSDAFTVQTRSYLHDLPGFRLPRGGEKSRRVDLALTSKLDGKRMLVSAKWSVRADREEQFGVDYEAYERLEDSGQDFDFVLVTNEFDAARLAAACHRRAGNHSLFSKVVHVNPEGPVTVYAGTERGAAAQLAGLIGSGRLVSLGQWLATFTP